jgi:hypothetical protein
MILLFKGAAHLFYHSKDLYPDAEENRRKITCHIPIRLRLTLPSAWQKGAQQASGLSRLKPGVACGDF